MKLCEQFIGFVQQFRQFADLLLPLCQRGFSPVLELSRHPIGGSLGHLERPRPSPAINWPERPEKPPSSFF